MNNDSHSFSVEIARKLKNVVLAILVQHFSFWHKKNLHNPTKVINGLVWFYCPIKGFEEIYPYLSTKVIRGAIDKLEKESYLASGNFNKLKFDRTKWYALTEKGCELTGNKLPFQKGKHDLSKRANGITPKGQMSFVQKGKPIPYSNTNVTTDITPIIPTGDTLSKTQKVLLKQVGKHQYELVINSDKAKSLVPKKKKLLIEYLKHRKEIKKPLKTGRSISAYCNRFNAYSIDDIRTVLDYTLDEGWTGLVWDKLNVKSNTSNTETDFQEPDDFLN